MKYDYLFVGCGLFSATLANLLHNKNCLIIDKRDHIGGNIYTECKDNINIHVYGPHVFHTNSKEIWDYINQFAEFKRFTLQTIANYNNELYNLPFNMNTFHEMWPEVSTPKEAKDKIILQSNQIVSPKNLEEQALSLVGKDIYEKLIKEYTEKQWNEECKNLPSFIIKRLPLRFTYNNDYFNDIYEGIPIGGYTQIIEKMIKNADVMLNTNFFNDVNKYMNIANKIIFTGPIDEFFNYKFGKLQYRSLKFYTKKLNIKSYQGCPIMNFTSKNVSYTRITEHKYFENSDSKVTYISIEYPQEWTTNKERFYPINTDENNELYRKYKKLASKQNKIIFGGRLGLYKYLDMDNTIQEAFNLYKKSIF